MAVVSDVADAAPSPHSAAARGAPDTALPMHRVRRQRGVVVLAVLAAALPAAFLLALALGSVAIPLDAVVDILGGGDAGRASWAVIIHDVRLPRAVTAALAGAALGIAGLQMQTLLRNPLADPFSLGITSGASLGVAAVVLGAGGGVALGGGLGGDAAVVGAAILGGLLVLGPVLAIAARVRNAATILIVGLMFGYAVQSIVTILVVGTSFEQLQRWIAWGFGSFSGVTNAELPLFAALVLAGILVAAASTKQLNALLLGETAARSLGLNTRRMRLIGLGGASVLAGVVTAYCGPIAFLGVAIPHLARGLVGSSDHRLLVPAAALLGATVALLAQIFALVAGRDGLLPLNAVTSLLGAPVVVFVILRARKGAFVA